MLNSTYGYEPVYFSLSEAGRLHSVLPMMEVNSWLTGRRAIPDDLDLPMLLRIKESLTR